MPSKKFPEKSSEDKLYFIIRYWLTSQIGGIVLYIIILILGSIDFIQAIIIGIFSFVFSIMISRYFEKYINNISKKIMKISKRHKIIENFITKRF